MFVLVLVLVVVSGVLVVAGSGGGVGGLVVFFVVDVAVVLHVVVGSGGDVGVVVGCSVSGGVVDDGGVSGCCEWCWGCGCHWMLLSTVAAMVAGVVVIFNATFVLRLLREAEYAFENVAAFLLTKICLDCCAGDSFNFLSRLLCKYTMGHRNCGHTVDIHCLCSLPIVFSLAPGLGERDEHLLREPSLPGGPRDGPDRLRGDWIVSSLLLRVLSLLLLSTLLVIYCFHCCCLSHRC